jgi:glutamate synthase domain-containing protein 2
MPMRDGVLFVNSALRGVRLRDQIRVIAAGKVVTGFHLVRAIALGADMCNAARSMMLALGCIQARRCNHNDCPVGVATQDPARAQGLVVDEKARRVARYHADTVHAFLELIAANGLDSPADIRPRNVLRRVDAVTIRPFSDVYEYLPTGCLLDASRIPAGWREEWERADADSFNTAPWTIAPPPPRALA